MVFCYCSHLRCADQKKGYIMRVHLWASSSPSFFFPLSFHTIFPHISSLPCVPSFYNVIPDFCWNICVEGWMYSDYILHKVFWWKGNCYPHFVHHICVSPSFWSPYWTKNVLPCKRLFVYWLNGCFGIAKGYVPPGDVIIPLCSCSHSCSHLCYLASPLFTPWVSMWLRNCLLVVVGQMCHLGACAWGYRVAVFILRVKKCYCTLLLSVEFKKKYPISYKYEPVQYNKVYTIVIHIASTCTWDPKLEAQKPEAVDNVICIYTRQCYYFILSVSSLMICDGLEFLNLCRTTCIMVLEL